MTASEQDIAVDIAQKTSLDRVVRVLEDSTVIKLEKMGLVSLAGIQFPKTYDSTTPSTRTTTTNTKLQQLLPPNSLVHVYPMTEKDNRGIRKVLLFHSSPLPNQVPTHTTTSIQTQLLLRGYATIRNDIDDENNDVATRFSPALVHEWRSAVEQHQEGENRIRPVLIESDFEPLRSLSSNRPKMATQSIQNPGDSKGCSDFSTYEDALRWYEYYYPKFGDVAKLDRDHDGIPCPGLPHTSDMELYRRKVPTTVQQQ